MRGAGERAETILNLEANSLVDHLVLPHVGKGAPVDAPSLSRQMTTGAVGSRGKLMGTGANRTGSSLSRGSAWLRGAGIAAAGAVAGLLLLSPAPAIAKDEFERAFKYELGRIAAHEAVGVGRAILGSVIYGPPVRAQVRYPRYDYGYPYPAYEYHEYHHYYHDGPPYGRARGHYKHYRRHKHHRRHHRRGYCDHYDD
jgi:hypothetical protein